MEVVVTLDVGAELMASSLPLLLVEVLEVALTLPGDFARGDGSTNELISTLAVVLDRWPAQIVSHASCW